jgi:hypothetical protein
VLIGTPAGSANDNKIEVILAQLRDRQIAVESVETYSQQQKAADKEKELREAEAKAAQQRILTESDINIQIQSNQGKADYQRSLQDAAKIKTIAEADAEREARVGIGRAIAIEEQVRAYGGSQYQVLQDIMNKFTSAIEKSKIDIVPKTVVNMGQNGGGANAFEMLLSLIISEKLGVKLDGSESKEENERVREIKESIFKSLNQVSETSNSKEVKDEISAEAMEQAAASK